MKHENNFEIISHATMSETIGMSGCLQNQLNKFPVDFKETSRRHFKKLSVGFYVVTA